MKRGQVTVIDFGLSIFIFTILVMVIIISLYDYHGRITSKLEGEMIVNTAVIITDNFVKTSGFPADWDNDTVQIIGLASLNRKISEEKVGEFCGNLTYEDSRKILKLMYHFHFSLYSPDDSFEAIECGLTPTDANKIVTIRRPVVYNDKAALIEFKLWR